MPSSSLFVWFPEDCPHHNNNIYLVGKLCGLEIVISIVYDQLVPGKAPIIHVHRPSLATWPVSDEEQAHTRTTTLAVQVLH